MENAVESDTGRPLLTLNQTAKLLNVSKKTLYYWVSRNEVPYLKIGRHLRFKFNDVLDFFEEQTRATKKGYRESPFNYGDLSSLKTRKVRKRGFAPIEKE
jgi:excisionase family DNA binding protein